jgi:hypothetical protein
MLSLVEAFIGFFSGIRNRSQTPTAFLPRAKAVGSKRKPFGTGTARKNIKG